MSVLGPAGRALTFTLPRLAGDVRVVLLTTLLAVALTVLLLPFGGNSATLLSPREVIAAGTGHACVVNSSAAVECWGNNSDGQLGVGTNHEHIDPQRVLGLSDVVAVSANEWHSCALTDVGDLYCWGGLNANGELGDGTFLEGRSEPTLVRALHDVGQVDAGQFHTCAVTKQGAAYCWGSNGEGQVGNGSIAQRPELLPEPVVGLESGVHAVAAGGRFSCALLTSGHVRCWGSNTVGQLGDGTRDSATEPVVVRGIGGEGELSNVVQLSAGWGHACALLSEGDVACWGMGGFGQLGDGQAPAGSNSSDSSGLENTYGKETPVRVQALGGRVAWISAGFSHTCALLADGRVQCWGANDQGQLGITIEMVPADPALLPGLVPAEVDRLPKASAISASYANTCALTEVGVMCWGTTYGFIAQAVPGVTVAGAPKTPAAPLLSSDAESDVGLMYEGFFNEAFERGNFQAAYAYLSADCRARVSFSGFEQYFSVARMFLAGATLTVVDVTILDSDEGIVTARVRLQLTVPGEPLEQVETDTFRAVYEDGAWRFADCEEWEDLGA
jgi:alpha-tubulin suppressor-like RCC1 family protein